MAHKILSFSTNKYVGSKFKRDKVKFSLSLVSQPRDGIWCRLNYLCILETFSDHISTDLCFYAHSFALLC